MQYDVSVTKINLRHLETCFDYNIKTRELVKRLKEVITHLRSQNIRLRERLTLLEEKQKCNDTEIDKINTSLVHVTRLNNDLSAALGSCYLCWGDDPECSNCSGKGIPGWSTINRRLFFIYVLPAIQKMEGIGK